MSPRRSSTVLPQTAASLALALACGSSSSGPPDGPPSTLALQEVTGNLDAPVFLTAPPGDPDRLFVVEKNGVIRIIRNNAILTTPFLDITSKTTKGSEQGLLGLAFHPDYASNGFFFVSYTAPGGGDAGHSVVARYQVSANPDVAGTAEVVVLTVDQPFSNHNGGMIAFGPDGYLYFGLGDGGDGGDPLETGQDRTDLLGSMLRLDINSPTYSIPAGNPYLGHPTFREEIWNYGLRNPWRFSFDRQTGDLYIGDVGQGSREEVNVVASGAGGGQDFGWDDMEGTDCYEDSNCASNPALRPVLDYGHGSGCAVTGGYVYRGAAIPAIQGMYFYSDYCTGFVRSFRFTGSGIAESFEWDNLRRSGGVTSFGEDGRGELYIMTESGRLFRFVPP
jgi:glucose/arabinose dehydrogenase